jgi:hypothetical protein
MVQLLRPDPGAQYRILDEHGRPIGRVIEPATPIRIGMGGETVLLVR